MGYAPTLRWSEQSKANITETAIECECVNRTPAVQQPSKDS